MVRPRLDQDRGDDLGIGRLTVLAGADRGRYPAVNSLLVEGVHETLVVDPGIGLVARGGVGCPVDRVINSHGHEDHVAGNCLFDDAEFHAHHADLDAIRSLDGLMAVYGLDADADREFRTTVVEEFSYVPRPEATGFGHGDVFDLGGSTVTVVHLPGHTRGHCGLLVEPESVMFVADIDLTGFGPYYGDAWSSLDDFVDSLAACRRIEADWYVTAHQKWVVEGRAEFCAQLERYEAAIGAREAAMLAFLAEPRTLADMVARRFVYRGGVSAPYVDSIERRVASLHLDRFVRAGAVTEDAPGSYRAVR